MCFVLILFSLLYRFTPVELSFMTEYVKTMSPVAKALDVLQGDTTVQMGWLVPTITLLKMKLQHLGISAKICEPLVASLLAGLESRFGEMLKDPELIAAAILVPKFKTCWTTDQNILKLGKCLPSYFSTSLSVFPAEHF